MPTNAIRARRPAEAVVSFIPLGSVGDIGAGCHYLKFSGTPLLLDSGMMSECSAGSGLPAYDRVGGLADVEAIVISHAHHDHIGSLPITAQRCPKAKIVMTEATRKIALLMLADSGRLMAKRAAADDGGGKPPHAGLYQEDALRKLFEERVVTVAYKAPLAVGGLTVRLFDAGHVLGSAMALVSDGQASVLYTGDFCDQPTLLHQGADFASVGKPDIVITESTYGSDMGRHDRAETVRKLGQAISATIARDAIALIPAFALGRTQEVLSAILALQKRVNLPADVPIYLRGGISRKINDIYEGCEWPEFDAGHGPIGTGAGIVIATSGFLTPGTASFGIASTIAPNSANAIIFPSLYCSKTSYYKNFIEALQPKCRMEEVDFSAHAKGSGIVENISGLKPQSVILVHGGNAQRAALQKAFQQRGITAFYPASAGDEILAVKSGGAWSVQWSADMEAVIVTVGTSALRSFEKKHGGRAPESVEELAGFVAGSPRNCAEMNTISRMPPQGPPAKRFFYLLASAAAKDSGMLCAQALALHLQDAGFRVSISPVDGLEMNARRFRDKGLPNLVDALISIALRHPRARIVATGGFKATTAFATLVGACLNLEVLYVHEDMSSDDPLVRMPAFPAVFDSNLVAFYASAIEAVVKHTDRQLAEKLWRKLPPQLQSLFDRDRNLALSPMGRVLWAAHRRLQAAAQAAADPGLKGAEKFGWPKEAWVMPGVWERGEDGTLTVRDACFETLRNRLRNHFLVTHVRVYPPEEGKPAAEAPLIKRLSVKRKKIDCYLRAGKLSQKLSIFVEPPFEHVVVSSIGVDLEWKPLSDL